MNTYQIKDHPECVHECHECTRLDAQECRHHPLTCKGQIFYGVRIGTNPLPDVDEKKPLTKEEMDAVMTSYYDMAEKDIPYWEGEIDEAEDRLVDAKHGLSVAIQTRDKIKDIYVGQKRHASELEVDEVFVDSMKKLYWKCNRGSGDCVMTKAISYIMAEINYRLSLQKRRKLMDTKSG